MLYNFRTMPTD